MSMYEVSKFEPHPNQELVCCICYCVLHQPRECRCRHVFCKICIETWLTNHYTCPTCRTSVHAGHLQPVLPLVQNMLNNLTMICDFRQHGCQEKITKEQYENHLNICAFRMVPCPNSGCSLQVPQNSLLMHEQECPFRRVVCDKGCELSLQQQHSGSHSCLSALRESLNESDRALQKIQTVFGWLRQKIELLQRVEGPPRLQARYYRNIVNQITRVWPSGESSPRYDLISPATDGTSGPNTRINIDEEISHSLAQPSLLEQLMEEASANGARDRDRARRALGPQQGNNDTGDQRGVMDQDRPQRNPIVFPDYFDTDSDPEYDSAHVRRESRTSSLDTSSLAFSSSDESDSFSSQASHSDSTTRDGGDNNDFSQDENQDQEDGTDLRSIFSDSDVFSVQDNDSYVVVNVSDNSPDNGAASDGDSHHAYQTHDYLDDNRNLDNQSRSSPASEGSSPVRMVASDWGNESDASGSRHDAGDDVEDRNSQHDNHAQSRHGPASGILTSAQSPIYGPRSPQIPHEQLSMDVRSSSWASQSNIWAWQALGPVCDLSRAQSPSREQHSPAVSSHSEISFNSNSPQFSSNNEGSNDDTHSVLNTHSDNNSNFDNTRLVNAPSDHDAPVDIISNSPRSDIDSDGSSVSHSGNGEASDNSQISLRSERSFFAEDPRERSPDLQDKSDVSISQNNRAESLPSVLHQPDSSDDHPVGEQTREAEDMGDSQPAPSSSSSTGVDSGFASSERKSDDSERDMGMPSALRKNGGDSRDKAGVGGRKDRETQHNAWETDSGTTSLDYSPDLEGDNSAAPDDTPTLSKTRDDAEVAATKLALLHQEAEASTSVSQCFSESRNSDNKVKPEKRRATGKGKGRSVFRGKGKALSTDRQSKRSSQESDGGQQDSVTGRKRKRGEKNVGLSNADLKTVGGELMRSWPRPVVIERSSDSELDSCQSAPIKKRCVSYIQAVAFSGNVGDEPNIGQSLGESSTTATEGTLENKSFESHNTQDNQNKSLQRKTGNSEERRSEEANASSSQQTGNSTLSISSTASNTDEPSTSLLGDTSQAASMRNVSLARSLIQRELREVLAPWLNQLLAVVPTPLAQATTDSPQSPQPEPALPPLRLSAVERLQHSAELLYQTPDQSDPQRTATSAVVPFLESASSVIRARSSQQARSPDRARSLERARSPVRTRSSVRSRTSISTRSRGATYSGGIHTRLRNRRGRSVSRTVRSRDAECETQLVRIPDIPVPPSTYQLLSMYAGSDNDTDSTWSPESD